MNQRYDRSSILEVLSFSNAEVSDALAAIEEQKNIRSETQGPIQGAQCRWTMQESVFEEDINVELCVTTKLYFFSLSLIRTTPPIFLWVIFMAPSYDCVGYTDGVTW